MSNSCFAIDAAAVLSPLDRYAPGRVIVRNGWIEAAGTITDIPIPEDAERIHHHDLTIVPGFIDPHIHGSAGADVMTGTFEALDTVSRALARHGTTAFLPTTVSAPAAILGPAIERIGNLIGQEFAGARPLGLHLEGPFISTIKRGTHQTSSIQLPNAEVFADWNQRGGGTVRLVTLAPEVPGAAAFIEYLKAQQVVIAMGHSNASFAQASQAADNGVCYAVHTFNAMRQFNHRDPGIVGAVLSDDRIYAEIIVDGIHVHPNVVRIFSRSKNRDHFLLVTDAISAADMPDGTYTLGDDSVQVTAGVCRNAEGHLAGSTLTQDTALANFIQWTGKSLADALMGLTANPAAALGLNDRGQISPGRHADLVLLDAGLRVMKTMVGGKTVFERQS